MNQIMAPRQHDGQDDQAGGDLQRHDDEEDRQPGHQPGQQADADVKGDAVNDEGRGDLHTHPEGAADQILGHGGQVAGIGHLARGKQGVAVIKCAQHHLMQVGGKDHHHAQHRKEACHHGPLDTLGRIDELGETEARLKGDDRAGGVQRGHHQAPDGADDQAYTGFAADQQ